MNNKLLYEKYKNIIQNYGTIVLFTNSFKSLKIRELRVALYKKWSVENVCLNFVKTKLLQKITGKDYKKPYYMLAVKQTLPLNIVWQTISNVAYYEFYKPEELSNRTVIASPQDTSLRPNEYFNYFKQLTNPVLKKGFVSFETPFILVRKNELISKDKAAAMLSYNFAAKLNDSSLFFYKGTSQNDEAWFQEVYKNMPLTEDASVMENILEQNMTYTTSGISNLKHSYSSLSKLIPRLTSFDYCSLPQLVINSRLKFILSLIAESLKFEIKLISNSLLEKQTKELKQMFLTEDDTAKTTDTKEAPTSKIEDNLDDLF